MTKIAVTGHRPNKLGNDYDLTSDFVLEIKENLILLIRENSVATDLHLITGMALGIDTLFAKIAIEQNILFSAFIPCMGQEKMWTEKSKEIYNNILEHPNCNVHYTSKQNYTPACMDIRNEAMVDSCNILIAVWDGTNGGTKNCYDYAIKQGKKIIHLDIKDMSVSYINFHNNSLL